MATFTFGPQSAVDSSGAIVRSGEGSVYAIEDTAFATPLLVHVPGDVTTTTIRVSDLGVVETFWLDDHPDLWWVSGGVVCRLVSPTGILDAVASSAATASSAQVAAAAAQAAAEEASAGNPALLPLGGQVGDVLYRAAQERVGEWGAPPAGGGGGGGLPPSYPSTWPSTFPASAHSHTTTDISNATTLGRNLLTAASQQAAREAIGAGTGNGTSNLSIGTTASTAAAGNHTHAASAVGFTPTGGLTATSVQDAIVQAAAQGGSSVASATIDVVYSAGAYPAQPGSAPAGVKVRHFYGPVQYSGPTWAGVLDLYTHAPLT